MWGSIHFFWGRHVNGWRSVSYFCLISNVFPKNCNVPLFQWWGTQRALSNHASQKQYINTSSDQYELLILLRYKAPNIHCGCHQVNLFEETWHEISQLPRASHRKWLIVSKRMDIMLLRQFQQQNIFRDVAYLLHPF